MVAIAIGVSCLTIPAAAEANIFDLNVNLSGLNEVGPNASPGTGLLTGTYDDVTNTLALNLTFSGLTANTTAAHLHAAAAGVNGPVIINFSPGFPTGVTSGLFSNSYVLTADQETNLLAGLVYVNIHTSGFPGGEIRGQLEPEAVPEPSSLALFGIGLAALGFVAWRKKYRRA